MTLGVDVGVDANRHPGHASRPRGDGLDAGELAGRFDVDRLEVQCHGGLELGV